LVAEDIPVRGPQRFVAFLLTAPFRSHLTYLLKNLLLFN